MKSKIGYQNHDHWQAYQSFFPEAMRLSHWGSPKEEYWRWKRINVHIDRYPSENETLGTIVLLHGVGGYSRMLSPLALDLNRSGYEVIAPDLPGYGLTKPESSDILFGCWINLVVDLVSREYQQNPRPIFLFGLSLGGIVAYHSACLSDHVKGIVVTTLCDQRQQNVRNAFSRFKLANPFLLRLSSSLAPIIGRFQVPISWVSKMHLLSNVAAFNKVALSDRLGARNRTPINFLLSIFSTPPSIEPENFEKCPVLLAHPSHDHWTPFELSKDFLSRIKGKKQIALLENCGHMPIEQPGITQLSAHVRSFITENIDQQ